MGKKQSSESEKRKRLKCEDCDFRATTPYGITRHREAVHLKLKPHSCKLCEFHCYNQATLNKHIMCHTGEKPFKCDQCPYTSRTGYDLETHRRYLHSDLKPFRCKECPFKGKTKTSIRNHERTHFPEKFKTLQCPQCSVLFASNHRLKMHLLTVHSEDRPFECPLCDYKAKTRQVLYIHTNFHAGIKRFKCQQCDWSFVTGSNLKKHSRARHSDAGAFACPIPDCDSMFKSSGSIRNHIRAVHNKERDLQCPLCPLAFCLKGNLERHIQRHTREKHLKCDFCDFRGSDKEAIRSHMLYIHTGSRNITCGSCDFSCLSRAELKKHQAVHDMSREFPCKHCNYRGSSISNLRKHATKWQHLQALPYSCRSCKSEFSSRYLRKGHERACKADPQSPEPSKRFGLTKKDCKPCSVIVRRL